MDTFQAFSIAHAAALLAILAATITAIRVAREASHPDAYRGVERSVGVAFLLVWIAVHGWWMLPPRIAPATTLPLQMCHLTAAAAGLYLVTRSPRLVALLYFWGFGLCTQALLTPTLQEGPVSHVFWYFWLSHGMIVGVTTYALAVHRYRPSWGDWRFACVAAAVYAAAVIPLNLAIGANYGFLGRAKPLQPTLVDLLGPWPQRLPAIFLIVALAMAVLMLPWLRMRPRVRA